MKEIVCLRFKKAITVNISSHLLTIVLFVVSLFIFLALPKLIVD